MASFVSAQLCVADEISVMSIACSLAFFSSCPACHTCELPCCSGTEILVDSPVQHGTSPRFCCHSSILKPYSWIILWCFPCPVCLGQGLPQTHLPHTWFWPPPLPWALWCSPLLLAASCVLVSFKRYLKRPFPAVSDSPRILLLIIMVLRRLKVLLVLGWLELAKDLVWLWVILGLPAL